MADILDQDGRKNSVSVNAGAEVALVDMLVSGNTKLVPYAWHNNSPVGFGSGAYWTIEVDGVAHENYTKVRDQYGTPNQVYEFPERIEARRRLRIIAGNDGLVAIDMEVGVKWVIEG